MIHISQFGRYIGSKKLIKKLPQTAVERFLVLIFDLIYAYKKLVREKKLGLKPFRDLIYVSIKTWERPGS